MPSAADVDPPAMAESDTPQPSPPWSPMAKLFIASGLALGLAVVFYMIRNVIAIGALAGLVAFLLAPSIRWLYTRARFPKPLALIVAYLAVFLGTLVFGFLIANAIVQAVVQLDPPAMVDTAREWLVEQTNELNQVTVFGISVDMSGVIDPVAGSIEDVGTGGEGSGSATTITVEQALAVAGGLFGSIRTVVGLMVAVVMSGLVTVLVAVYLNADSARYHDALIRNVPPGYEGDASNMLGSLKRTWTGYMYGQLVNSAITGIMVWLVLWAVGLPGAFFMGFVMAVLNMIPTFGPIFAAVPGVLAAFVYGSTRFEDMSHLVFGLLVAGIYVVVVQLQANLIAPRVMGQAVSIRPAIVMVGLMAGAAVGGLLGALLAVPVLASLRDVVAYIYAKLIDRDPFPDAEPRGETTTSSATAA
jgi:predicted PurR-regulated permease PerM